MKAIDKMVEWFDKHPSHKYHYAQREARRLALEEAKEIGVEVGPYDDLVCEGCMEKIKPTAPACPTCGVGVKLTERRIDGNSTCFNGHTHKTKDFYRSSTQADIVGELKRILDQQKVMNVNLVEVINVKHIEEIIRKHEGAK